MRLQNLYPNVTSEFTECECLVPARRNNTPLRFNGANSLTKPLQVNGLDEMVILSDQLDRQTLQWYRFLWGYLKNKVYTIQPTSITASKEELLQKYGLFQLKR